MSRYVFDSNYNIRNPHLNIPIQPIHDDLPFKNISEKLLQWCVGPVFNTYASMYITGIINQT